MKRFNPLIILLFLSACAVQVRSIQNPKADFNSYESWCWMQGCEIVYQGPKYYFDQRSIDEVANAIAWNMHNKGYIQGDDQSDLVLNFYLTLSEDSVDARDLYYGTYQDEREWLMVLYPEYQQFLKGTLVIDAVDRKTSELIWTSKAQKYLEVNPSFDKKAIWNGVGKAMKKFPGKP